MNLSSPRKPRESRKCPHGAADCPSHEELVSFVCGKIDESSISNPEKQRSRSPFTKNFVERESKEAIIQAPIDVPIVKQATAHDDQDGSPLHDPSRLPKWEHGNRVVRRIWACSFPVKRSVPLQHYRDCQCDRQNSAASLNPQVFVSEIDLSRATPESDRIQQ